MRRKKTNKTKLFFKILGYTVLAIIIFSIALTIYSVFGPKEDFTTPIKNNYAIIKESSRSAYIINKPPYRKQQILNRITPTTVTGLSTQMTLKFWGHSILTMSLTASVWNYNWNLTSGLALK